jgi:glycine/D-amino acid oxidase-like deaminating enzyme
VYSDKAERRYGHLEKISESHFSAHKKPRYITTELGWIIEPATFLQSIPRPRVEKLKTVMTSLERVGEMWQVGIMGGIKIEADIVVMATGPWSEWTRELFVGSPLESMKSTQGSFFQWDNAAYGAKSFVIGLEGMVCVYHADLQRLILGATSVSGDATFIPNMSELNAIRDEFTAHVKIELPSEKPEIITGLRAQTKGRRPWAGAIGSNLYAVGGLYKTGWVTAWPLGDRLAAML